MIQLFEMVYKSMMAHYTFKLNLKQLTNLYDNFSNMCSFLIKKLLQEAPTQFQIQLTLANQASDCKSKNIYEVLVLR